MIKKIKNNDSVAHTYSGQEILVGAYYQIQPHEEINWMNDPSLISDIGSAKAIVNDGSSDITNINLAINYLKNITPSYIEIDRKYANVSAFTTDDYDHVVPNGKTLTIIEMGANAVQKATTKSCIIWDQDGAQEEILLATVGDTTQKTFKTFIGNGTRVMRIRLDNQDSVSQTLGAYYIGSEV